MWRDHILSMGSWRGGERVQGAVSDVGFEHGHPEVQEVSGSILKQ